MVKPDSVFQTSIHTVFATDVSGIYRTEPGGLEFSLTAQTQQLPQELLYPEMERAVMAWIMSRGGREMNLNGQSQPIAPAQLDRLPASIPQRLVSIAPSNAEIVGALGAVDRLVGVENSSDYPPQVKSLPRLGSDLNVDSDSLKALQPDMVLASLSVPGMERNIAMLVMKPP